MSTDVEPSVESSRKVLVGRETRRVPDIVRQLNQWGYLERSIHRILCGWGRFQSGWQDKAVLHRHVWDQAEIVRRLRQRVSEFPGGKMDADVPVMLEEVANAALLAPSFEDAIDGVYNILLRVLIKGYVDHVQRSHPVHDAPGAALLHEINTIKEQHFLWYRDYRRRHPHTTDRTYRDRLESMVTALGGLLTPLPKSEEAAKPCGVRCSFSLPLHSGCPSGWAPDYDIMPYISQDFAGSAETRRLFWGIAYMREMSLPDDQLRWLFYGHYMPWEWQHDISRHLWDESRHGLSGYSRLQDWGISIHDVGFIPNSAEELRRLPATAPLVDRMIKPFLDESEIDWNRSSKPMTQEDIYNAVFFIGMVAENGHFMVKNEAYDDFRNADDLESAEMMLFDIIDETTHVQYAHRWLPMLAEHAKIDNTDFRERAVRQRAEFQAREDSVIAEAGSLPRQAGFGPWDHYQSLLQRIRKSDPLPESTLHMAPRSRKPM